MSLWMSNWVKTLGHKQALPRLTPLWHYRDSSWHFLSLTMIKEYSQYYPWPCPSWWGEQVCDPLHLTKTGWGVYDRVEEAPAESCFLFLGVGDSWNLSCLYSFAVSGLVWGGGMRADFELFSMCWVREMHVSPTASWWVERLYLVMLREGEQEDQPSP